MSPRQKAIPSFLDEMPQPHPRESLVREAEEDLRKVTTDWLLRWEGRLSPWEVVAVITQVFSCKIAAWANCGVRDERRYAGAKK